MKYSISIDNCSQFDCDCSAENIKNISLTSINHIMKSYENPNINIVSSGGGANNTAGNIARDIEHVIEHYTIDGIGELNEIKEFFYMNYAIFANINIGKGITIKRIGRKKVHITRPN